MPIFVLPLVENISLSGEQGGLILRWNALADSFLYAGEHLSLYGYNVYCFNDSSFIPRKASFTRECSYKDMNKGASTYYIVRGVYIFQGRHIEGPSSNIILTSFI